MESSLLPAGLFEDTIAEYLDVTAFVALKQSCREMRKRLDHIRFIQNAEARTQRVVWEATDLREDILLLGPGGCGKTYTLQALMKRCDELGLKYAITSSTGISACNFGEGQTLHKFSGLGLARMSLDDIQNRYDQTGKVYGKFWKKIDLLIVDEISMVGKRFFEKVELCARLALGDPRPFGNLQVVFSGDFLQLPPVMDRFLFESSVYKQMDFRCFYLENPVRQANDLAYFNLLQRVRLSETTADDIRKLENRVRKDFVWEKDENGFIPPKLYPQNKSVGLENKKMFKEVPGPIESTFFAQDIVLKKVRGNNGYVYIPTNDLSLQEAYTRLNPNFNIKYPKKLKLKAGAQYFLTTNLNVKRGWVNGTCCLYQGDCLYLSSRGSTKKISCPQPVRTGLGGDYFLERKQLPLKLGYAVTIHSSQGMTLDRAAVSLGKNIFTSAQIYVALSRVRSLKGVYLIDFDPKKIRSHQKAKQEYLRLLKTLE